MKYYNLRLQGWSCYRKLAQSRHVSGVLVEQGATGWVTQYDKTWAIIDAWNNRYLLPSKRQRWVRKAVEMQATTATATGLRCRFSEVVESIRRWKSLARRRSRRLWYPLRAWLWTLFVIRIAIRRIYPAHWFLRKPTRVFVFQIWILSLNHWIQWLIKKSDI